MRICLDLARDTQKEIKGILDFEAWGYSAEGIFFFSSSLADV